jgi:hypothetical protein
MERNISLFGLRSLSRVEKNKKKDIVIWIGEVVEQRKNHETFVLTVMNFGTVDLPKRWDQQCPVRRWYLYTKLYAVTSNKKLRLRNCLS